MAAIAIFGLFLGLDLRPQEEKEEAERRKIELVQTREMPGDRFIHKIPSIEKRLLALTESYEKHEGKALKIYFLWDDWIINRNKYGVITSRYISGNIGLIRKDKSCYMVTLGFTEENTGPNTWGKPYVSMGYGPREGGIKGDMLCKNIK